MSPTAAFRILVLGGTTEAGALTQALAGDGRLSPMLSLAGRTKSPSESPIPRRIGGFGGVDGLAAFLRDGGFRAVVDATHPFAATISTNATIACERLALPLARFTRPPWLVAPGDRWICVATLAEAASALGPEPRRVFLTTGRLDLAAFRAAAHHHYLVRTIDPPDPIDLPPNHDLLLTRPPFDLETEIALMRARRIDMVVSKNSGGAAASAKLAAARILGLPVVMVERPAIPQATTFTRLAAVLAWVEAQHGAP